MSIQSQEYIVISHHQSMTPRHGREKERDRDIYMNETYQTTKNQSNTNQPKNKKFKARLKDHFNPNEQNLQFKST